MKGQTTATRNTLFVWITLSGLSVLALRVNIHVYKITTFISG